jgi:hypothetical protein
MQNTQTLEALGHLLIQNIALYVNPTGSDICNKVPEISHLRSISRALRYSINQSATETSQHSVQQLK